MPAADWAGRKSPLAGSRSGTEWLLDLNAKKKLPDDLKKGAAIVLRNSQFPDLRNKAMIAFPPPGKIDPNKLPDIGVLATVVGGTPVYQSADIFPGR